MKISIPSYSNTAESKEAIELNVAKRFEDLNTSLISQALYVEANRQQIKAGRAKTKGEVSGGGRKPFKQKGTGRARAGSNRSPLWRGGGITFGPTGINKVLELPKKMKQLAFGQLLVAKFKAKEVVAVEDLKIKNAKTKEASNIISKIAQGKKAQVFVSLDELPETVAFRNLAQSTVNTIDKITFKDLSSSRIIILTAKVLEPIKEKLAK